MEKRLGARDLSFDPLPGHDDDSGFGPASFLPADSRTPEQAVADGRESVVAAGGDGTVNAVISGLVGGETALGVFPTGTMNLFARELDLPTNDLRGCWEVIEAGETRKVDLFSANDQVFVQRAGRIAYVVNEHRMAERRQIETGARSLGAVQILAGLQPGETIVVSNLDPFRGADTVLLTD